MAFGAGLFLALPLGIQSTCPPEQPTAWHIEGYEPATKNKRDPKKSAYTATQKKETDKQDYGTNNGSGGFFKSLLCKELKATDLVTVFLTYCLVIIGGFAIVVLDKTTKRSERAYLVVSPPYGVPRRPEQTWAKTHRAMASMFKGPWRMTIQNFGRTAGFTTKVEWGLCPENEFKRYVLGKGVLVSKLLTKRKYREWRSHYMDERSPVTIQDIFGPTKDPLQSRHVQYEDRPKIGMVFFGRITYKDVFGDEHFSTFSYETMEYHSNSIGKSLSDDHS